MDQGIIQVAKLKAHFLTQREIPTACGSELLRTPMSKCYLVGEPMGVERV